MKRTLLVGLGIMGCVAMNAQTTLESTDGNTFVPAAFTTDSKARLVTYDDYYANFAEGENMTADVYNSSFTKETSFNVRRDKYLSYQTQEREEVAILTDTREEGVTREINEEELIAWSDSSYSSGGFTYYVTYYYDSWKFGKMYPQEMYRLKGDSVTFITNYYENKYDGDWKVDYENYSYVRALYNHFNVLDSNPYDYDINGLYFSQTLFNDDEKYEYAFPKYTLVEERTENDRDGDGDIDEISVSYSPVYSGFDVISEDGSTVSSFTFTHNTHYLESMNFIFWDGKTYLCIGRSTEEDSYWESYEDYYLFDKASNQITRTASSNLMRLTPAVAKKSSTVTVELNEETRKNGGELIVNDMSGRRVYSRYVHAGETSVQIPAFRLSSGIFVVSFNNDGKKMETSKLIVQ